jgi:hypothetical protein
MNLPNKTGRACCGAHLPFCSTFDTSRTPPRQCSVDGYTGQALTALLGSTAAYRRLELSLLAVRSYSTRGVPRTIAHDIHVFIREVVGIPRHNVPIFQMLNSVRWDAGAAWGAPLQEAYSVQKVMFQLLKNKLAPNIFIIFHGLKARDYKCRL